MTRNEIFSCAVDYLYKEGKITGQSDLAEKTGITETTISRILNNKVRKPSEDSLRRFNLAFGGIFNPDWLRGKGGDMLIQKQPSTLEVGAENLINLAAKLIKENEHLHRELKDTLTALRAEIANLKNTSQPKRYITTDMDMLNESSQTDTFNQ